MLALHRALVLALALSLASGFARAADVADPTPPPSPFIGEPVRAPTPWISEIRGGVMYHEDSRLRRLLFNQSRFREDGIIDLNGEVLFAKPQWTFGSWLLDFVLRPRVRVGASINIGRGTSQASAGLAWDTYIWKNVFWEGSLDIAVHNGWTGITPSADNLRMLGCSPILRQSVSLGVDVTEHWRVMATFEHLDNFKLCNSNQGLSNLGLRVGYRF
jgi:lipid A 3-O-deacylase